MWIEYLHSQYSYAFPTYIAFVFKHAHILQVS